MWGWLEFLGVPWCSPKGRAAPGGVGTIPRGSGETGLSLCSLRISKIQPEEKDVEMFDVQLAPLVFSIIHICV